MNYYLLVIKKHFQNSPHSLSNDELSEVIHLKANHALEEFENLRLSGLDVNTAQEIVMTHLLENLNPIIAN
jgi:hypothetical protein